MNTPPPRISPIDAGPWVTLPTARLLAAMVVGAGLAAGLAWAMTYFLKPSGIRAVPWGFFSAIVAHGVAIGFIRPWRPRYLGQWAFAVLRASLGAILLVLLSLVLVYSATRPDPVILGLTAVGAWFVGLLSLVSAYGSYVKGLPGEPTPVQ
jgi:hypothetical protein